MSKSDHEKSEIRRQAEARRQSGKDRTAHAGRRGQKTMSLSNLSRMKPSAEQLENYKFLLLDESDRGAAIMAGALVENALLAAIRAFMIDPGEETANAWFESPAAPFGTFSAKIKLGRALAVYDENFETRLGLIKDVRNAFAHSSIPLDFKHPTMVHACKNLNANPAKYGDREPRFVFFSYCLAVFDILIRVAMDQGGKEIKVHIQ